MGRRLFGQALSNISLACIRQSITLPKHIWELVDEAAKCVNASDPPLRVLYNLLPVTDFISAVGRELSLIPV